MTKGAWQQGRAQSLEHMKLISLYFFKTQISMDTKRSDLEKQAQTNMNLDEIGLSDYDLLVAGLQKAVTFASAPCTEKS